MGKEEGIIQTIQRMVSEGESEEKIVGTLRQMDIPEEQAKRLLLVAQAETFELLKKEIAEIVEDELRKEMPRYIQTLSTEAREAGRLNKEVITQDIQRHYRKVSDLEGFEDEIRSRVRSAIDSSNIARQKLAEIEKRLSQTSEDVENLKAKNLGTRRRTFSMLLLALGVGMAVASIYLLFSIQENVSVKNIALTAVMALVGISSMFLSSRV